MALVPCKIIINDACQSAGQQSVEQFGAAVQRAMEASLALERLFPRMKPESEWEGSLDRAMQLDRTMTAAFLDGSASTDQVEAYSVAVYALAEDIAERLVEGD